MSKESDTQKSSHNISVLTRDGYKYFEVHPEVYTYILQLEAYIKYPELSKLKEVYSDRFS